jgi:hypothetical protein
VNLQLWADAALQAVTAIGSGIVNFADSNFFVALVTALAGAAAGALGAQWIVSRNESKRRLLEEIRATNAAIIVAFEIINTFCSLKSQHVRRLKETFDAQERAFHEAFERNQRGQAAGEVFEVQFDFQILTFPRTPTDILQHLLVEKVSVAGRALSAFARLLSSLDGLSDALRGRNEFIAEIKAEQPHRNTIIARYFGLPTGGREDLTYPSTVNAISLYTDDTIFFTHKLMEDLTQHGRNLAAAFGKRAPKVQQPDFAKAREQKLIPDDAQYADWVAATKGLLQPPTTKQAATGPRRP